MHTPVRVYIVLPWQPSTDWQTSPRAPDSYCHYYPKGQSLTRVKYHGTQCKIIKWLYVSRLLAPTVILQALWRTSCDVTQIWSRPERQYTWIVYYVCIQTPEQLYLTLRALWMCVMYERTVYMYNHVHVHVHVHALKQWNTMGERLYRMVNYETWRVYRQWRSLYKHMHYKYTYIYVHP